MIILSLIILLNGQPTTIRDVQHPFYYMETCKEQMAIFKAILDTDKTVHWRLLCQPVNWRPA